MTKVPVEAAVSAWRQIPCFLLVLGAFLAPVLAEDEPTPEKKTYGTRVGEGVGREQMWPAPTAVDWAKPVLLRFQRTWEDALAVSRETGKPILCCINMDGEIASEHYAGVRYREPEIAELYKPYVCVIASVYRHAPRDYDDQGRRILCPRFGSVTCGEHIAIEPILFEKFLDGQRVAPRHIMVDLDGNEIFDAFYVNDTAGVFDQIRDGPEKVPPPRPETVRGDRPLVERVASRHIDDREAVESAYEGGDEATRRQLLEAAAKSASAAPLDLVRLAVFGLDVEAAKLAREALAKTDTPAATELISDALQAPLADAERAALIGALKRLGGASSLARWLAGVHGGLAASPDLVDAEAWEEARRTGTYPAPVRSEDPLVLRAEDAARAAEIRPEDPAPRLDFAEATLALALETARTYAANPRRGEKVAAHLFTDARRAALEAESLGATGWRPDSVLALSAYYAGDLPEAYTRAEAAMRTLPPGLGDWQSMALVTVFAESRWKAIKQAVRDNKEWPPAYLADLDAAYSILRKHPLGTDDQVTWHYELLMWLGAGAKAIGVLHDGIERFRDSAALHQRLREHVVGRRGPAGLEQVYASLLEQYDDPARLAAYAGLASILAGDHYRRRRDFEQALAAYTRGIALYERAIAAHEAHAEGGTLAIALTLGARARVHYELGDDTAALADILSSYARGPSMAGTRDGMNVTPGETGQMLLARMKTADEAAAARLEEALSKLDQDLLVPDAGLMGDGGR
ncbi:MAG: hypothetical protein O2894_08770 [Planctomycetota bacterium]|nr:hypothetical protein [Planctomycetota bacterium]